MTLAAERPAGLWNRAAFAVLYYTVGLVVRAYFRVEVVGRVPDEGACVVAANHTSFLDPIVLSAVSRRRVTFLMTIVVFRGAWLGWFYRLNRAIPVAVRGGGNRDALRAARSVLGRDEVLGIFPEGGISRDGIPMGGHPGAVSLGMASGAPIVPVAIQGAFDAMPPGAILPRPVKIRVIYGEPIDVDSLEGADNRRQRLSVATRAIMERIAALRL